MADTPAAIAILGHASKHGHSLLIPGQPCGQQSSTQQRGCSALALGVLKENCSCSNPLEETFDGSRGGAGWAARPAGDCYVLWSHWGALLVATACSLQHSIFLLRGRCQQLPSPRAAALPSTALSFCLPGREQLPQAAHGMRTGMSQALLLAMGASLKSTFAP